MTSANSSNVLREMQASRRQAQGEPPAHGSPRDGRATTETPLSRTRVPGGDQVRSPHFDDNLDELAELRSNRTARLSPTFFDDINNEYDIDSGEETEDSNLDEVRARPRGNEDSGSGHTDAPTSQTEARPGEEVTEEDSSTPENAVLNQLDR